jgi:hypothetical protein
MPHEKSLVNGGNESVSKMKVTRLLNNLIAGMHAGTSRSRRETVKGPKQATLVLLRATTIARPGTGKTDVNMGHSKFRQANQNRA